MLAKSLWVGRTDEQLIEWSAYIEQAKQAGIEEYQLNELPKIKDPFEKYIESFGVTKSKGLALFDHPAIEELHFLTKNPGLQARLNPIFFNK